MYYGLLDVLVKGRPMSQLEVTLRKDWLYPHPEALVPFLSNHDQPRFLSQPGATPALLRLGLGLLLTLRGMPELYAGDEIEMRGGQDPDNRRDFPGGFPGDVANAFTAGGRSAEQNSMHDWVAALGRLRSQTAALQSGRLQTVVSGKSTFAYVRTLAAGSACSVGGSMLIVVNRDASPASVEVPVANTALAGCHAIIPTLGDRQSTVQHISGTTVTVQLPAFGFEVFTLR
jgi:glycosidase